MAKTTTHRKTARSPKLSPKEMPIKIEPLLQGLRSSDGFIRVQARESLVALGKTAVEALIPLLKDPHSQVRWEAAKALATIAAPQSAPALVDAMEDADYGIRWIAAEGLIAMGPQGLAPLLEALTKRSKSGYLRQGAHHVCHDLSKMGFKDFVESVLSALEKSEPEFSVLEPAREALDNLRRKMMVEAS